MRYRWISIPTLAVGMLVLSVSNGLAQRGGPPGSSGERSRGMPSPDEVWARYGGGAGDTIDLTKNPQMVAQLRMKGYTIPQDGVLRKAEFLPQVAARMQSMGMGGPPGSMGGPPPVAAVPSGDKPAVILSPGETTAPPGTPGAPQRGGPPGSDRGGDRGRGGPPGEERSRGGPPGSGGWGSRGGEETRKTEDLEEERPNVLRYGKTPKELPGWFTELDTDKDAQIGLYEWRAASKSIDDFVDRDTNGDGFLTVDEVLKNPASGKTSETKTDSRGANPFSSKGSPPSSSNDPRSSKSDNNGKIKGDKSERTEAKPSKEEKKSEPSTGGNPFLKK